MKYKNPRRIGGPLILLLFLLAAGCAHRGPRALFPGRTEEEGYRRSGRDWVYSDRGIMVRAGEVRDGRGIVKRLIHRGYVVMRLSIENRSKERVMFDPAHVSLRYDAMGYEKPLDYTDFYEMSLSDGRTGEALSNIKEIFYDLTTAVPRGGAVSKLLAFRPMEEDAKSAELVIKNIYRGTDVIDVRFPFELRPVSEFRDYKGGPGY